MIKNKRNLWLLPLIIALLCPLFIKNNYIISVLINCFIFAALGTSWNLIGGYGGQTSWCHSSFVAIGAYTSAVMYVHFNISPLISIFFGMLLSAGFATLIGKVTLRYSGYLFAIATIAFGEILKAVVLNLKITKGSAGIGIPYRGASPLNLIFQNDIPHYYISIAVLVLMLFIAKVFVSSRPGYYLRTIKGNELAAQTLGCDTSKTKVFAFQISAMMASFVGTFYAFYMALVEPNTICGMDLAVKISATAIIGGMSTLFGPVIGAFVVVLSMEVAADILGSSGGTQIIYGFLLVAIILLRPQGLISLFTKDTFIKCKKFFARKKLTKEEA